MNIQRAKQEIKDTVEAYLLKDEHGEYEIPSVRQRPILLIGAPGIGKTQIMEQVAEECGIGLVAYTITHHTRQSAIGLPFIVEKEFHGQRDVSDGIHDERDRSFYLRKDGTDRLAGGHPVSGRDQLCLRDAGSGDAAVLAVQVLW